MIGKVKVKGGIVEIIVVVINTPVDVCIGKLVETGIITVVVLSIELVDAVSEDTIIEFVIKLALGLGLGLVVVVATKKLITIYTG